MELHMVRESEFRERVDARSDPAIDLGLDAWSPHRIDTSWTPWSVFRQGRLIIVIAPTTMLGAVSAMVLLADEELFYTRDMQRYHWGKFSSQRICLLLQVLHPFLDFV